MKLQQLLEALKPSQYRELVKGWDKSKYADLFGGKYRIYIPLEKDVTKPKQTLTNAEVFHAVNSSGYEIEDYLTGIASKDNGKRKIKIGKLLADKPDIKKIFDSDPERAGYKNKDQLIVISRHPYDIAGMSTDRGWTSCMNLENGNRKEYIPLDIKEGTIIAYLIDTDDKNINHPSARMLIKPFVNTENGDIVFGLQDMVYGVAPDSFQKTILKWVNKVNDEKTPQGIYKLNDKLYTEINDDIGVNTKVYGVDGLTDPKKLISVLVDKPEMIRDMKGLSDDILIPVIEQNIYAINYIDNPSEKVMMAVVKQDGSFLKGLLIKHKNNLPFNIIITALENTPTAAKFLYKPSIELLKQLASSTSFFAIYPHLRNNEELPPEVLDIAIQEDPDLLEIIKTPSEELQKKAVHIKSKTIQYIKEPSEEIQMMAVKRNINNIEYIKYPSEKVLKYVKDHSND